MSLIEDLSAANAIIKKDQYNYPSQGDLLKYYFWGHGESQDFESMVSYEIPSWLSPNSSGKILINSYGITKPLYDYQKGKSVLETSFSYISQQLNISFNLVSNKADVLDANGSQSIFLSVAVVDRQDGSDNHFRKGLDKSKNNILVFDKDALNVSDKLLAFYTLHETSHAFGLAHPKDSGLAGSKYDSQKYSIMSYRGHTSFDTVSQDGQNGLYKDVVPDGFMLLDYLAFQQKGLLTNYEVGDNSYEWGESEKTLHTIYDTDGTDTFSAAGHQRNTIIDLREGHFSSYGSASKGKEVPVENIAIAYGTKIENAIGGDKDDVLIGNDTNNELKGEKGNDFLYGNGADYKTEGWSFSQAHKNAYTATIDASTSSTADNDTLYGGDGHDYLSGGSGNDSLFGETGSDQLDGGKEDDTLDGGEGNDILEGGTGNDTYKFTGQFGRDMIKDSDNQGSIEFNSVKLSQLTQSAKDSIIY